MDIKNPLEYNENNNFCMNCGKIGHVSKKCLFPIISIGIICIKLNLDDYLDLNSIINYTKKIQNNYLFTHDEIIKIKNLKTKLDLIKIEDFDNLIQYLLIERKNSLNYVEIIRGKYNLSNLDYLQKSINFITVEEKKLLNNYNFEKLWKDLWNETIINNNNEFKDSKEKFNLLKKGLFIKKNDINIYISLKKLIDDSIYNFKYPEWGFPKGRRNLKEKNIECAKREFYEETNIAETNYNIVNMTPIEETYLASNNLKYKHIYYISQIKNNKTILTIDKNNYSQKVEIGNISWLSINDALEIIRDYNIEKKNVLINLHINIKYIIDNFKISLSNFS